ncbi:hypothetical protein C8J57DRAFT_1230046 [Mycena rebaudengoi]|nr:hypothetical protein C8J57DRAFT_1230046 [Mycena rebaudengoi]
MLIHVCPDSGRPRSPGVPTHEWAAHNQHLLTYVQQMQRHGLLLSFSVPRAGTVSPTDFTSKVRSGLAHSGLSLPDSPTPLSESQASELHYQPFALLTPNRRGTSHRFIPHPKINANFFTFAEFARLNKKFSNPTPAMGNVNTLIVIVGHKKSNPTTAATPTPNPLLVASVHAMAPSASNSAESVEAGARGLVALLHHLERREGPAEPFLLPAGVFRCQEVLTKESFFKELPMLAMSSREWCLGNRPWAHARRLPQGNCDMVEDHNYWQQAPSSAFYIPVFSASMLESSPRTQTFCAHGTLLAVHAYTLSQGPRPISMWLLLALIAGRDGMLIPQQYLAALDPVAFDRLAPWLTLAPEDEIPTSLCIPFPSMISSPRTRAEHDDWTITFMSKVLLGDTQLWTRPEFLAMRRGFNVTIGNTTLVEQFIQRRTALHMLSTLYDRQVRDIDDFSRHLVFRILMSSNDGTTTHFAALFRLLVQRYLKGTGHPAYLRGSLIQEDEFANKAEDSLLRARLFLGASSDSDLLPMSEAWTIKFNIVGLNAPTNPIFAETEPRALHFHTCSYEIDVKLTAPMQALLIAACNNLDDLTHTSPFDAWFHAQILGRDHNTM